MPSTYRLDSWESLINSEPKTVLNATYILFHLVPLFLRWCLSAKKGEEAVISLLTLSFVSPIGSILRVTHQEAYMWSLR